MRRDHLDMLKFLIAILVILAIIYVAQMLLKRR